MPPCVINELINITLKNQECLNSRHYGLLSTPGYPATLDSFRHPGAGCSEPLIEFLFHSVCLLRQLLGQILVFTNVFRQIVELH